jgi:hypothetical protein
MLVRQVWAELVLTHIDGPEPGIRERLRSPEPVCAPWVVDAACFLAAFAFAAVVAWMAARPFFGQLPDQNAFYSADTGRVFAYLSGSTEGYYRMKVHPLYGWFCIFYQFIVMGLLHVPASAGIPALSSAISVGCSALLYAVMRRLCVSPLLATSFVVLFCSSASYVFWCSLPETHMLGGASVLVAVLLMTGPDARTGRGASFRSAAALVAGCSIVVTNGMVWVLKQVDFAKLRSGELRPFIRENCARARSRLSIALWGVGLTYLLWSPEWPILGKRVGIPFNFLEERNYVELQPNNSILSMHIFGLTPPQIPFDWLVPALCIAATIASLFVLRTRQWFVPLFPLFGLVLHSVYSGDSAFLFSPDYMPLFIVTLALVAKERLPGWMPMIVIPVAALLLFVNLDQWQEQMNGIAAMGQMRTFETVTLH